MGKIRYKRHISSIEWFVCLSGTVLFDVFELQGKCIDIYKPCLAHFPTLLRLT